MRFIRQVNVHGGIIKYLSNLYSIIKQCCLPHMRSTGRSGSGRLWHNKSCAAFVLCVTLVQRPHFALTAFRLTLLHTTMLINL